MHNGGTLAMAVSWLPRFPGWEEEEFPCVRHFSTLPVFAVIFPSFRYFLDRFVLERLGRRLVLGSVKGLSQAEIDERQKKVVKFKESAWKCLYFLSAELLALYITYDEPWFRETKFFWFGPGDQIWPDLKVKTKLRTLYMYSGGFYAYSIFALLFWETRRSDFGINMSHHFITLALIIFSYLTSFSRAGSVVLALHDASDVFLEIGKMSKYTGSVLIPEIAFALFAISWVILRLIYFPFWIIWSTSYGVLQNIDRHKHKGEGPFYYYVLNSLLINLFVLHIYWWVLIFRMIVKQIQAKGKIGEDVRSDSEGEKDD